MPTLQRSCIPRLPVRTNKGRLAVLLVLAGVLLVSILLGLLLGSNYYTPGALLSALQAGREDPVFRILVYVRLPRVVGSVLAGAALALAGMLLQSVLNNPMASPNIIGVNAGAGFFGLLAGALLPGATAAAAFLGALVTALFIFLLARRAGLSRTTLVLAGVAVNAILNAGVQTLNTLFPELAIGSGFLAGSFAGVTFRAMGNAGWFLALGAVLALVLTGELNVLRLGEESAASLGMAVGRVRFLSILLIPAIYS